MAKLKTSVIAVLDIGTSKVVCFIAKLTSSGEVVILGIGHQVSEGIRSGMITDITLAEESIRSAVGAAEYMAGINIDTVIVNISGNKQISSTVKVEVDIKGRAIAPRDLSRILSQGREHFSQEGYDIIHCIPAEYIIDGTGGIRNPLGMFGNVLQARLHVISVASTVLMNLTKCLAQCHLNIEGFIASPYASGAGCLSEDEKELGVTVIDFGGGSTSVAIYKSGGLVFTDTIPLGGKHITNDIAICLSTTIETAERVKTLHGNVFKAAKDEQEIIDIPQTGEDGIEEIAHIIKLDLIQIIRPRVDEILDLLKEHIGRFGIHHMGGHIVVTGGGSQLTGIGELVEEEFGRQVRTGNPRLITGMAESTKGPAFSCAIGMLQLIRQQRALKTPDVQPRKRAASGSMGKVLVWLKENF